MSKKEDIYFCSKKGRGSRRSLRGRYSLTNKKEGAKAGISTASYCPKTNSVKEVTLKRDTYWSPEMEQYFLENLDQPIYGWYSSDYIVAIIVESELYQQEWAKIIEGERR